MPGNQPDDAIPFHSHERHTRRQRFSGVQLVRQILEDALLPIFLITPIGGADFRHGRDVVGSSLTVQHLGPSQLFLFVRIQQSPALPSHLISAIATLLTPLQARYSLPSLVATMFLTTPPPEGIGVLANV